MFFVNRMHQLPLSDANSTKKIMYYRLLKIMVVRMLFASLNVKYNP